jgi:hypothetical protein
MEARDVGSNYQYSWGATVAGSGGNKNEAKCNTFFGIPAIAAPPKLLPKMSYVVI